MTLRPNVLVCKVEIADLFCLFKGTGATEEETDIGLRSQTVGRGCGSVSGCLPNVWSLV